LGTSCLHTRHGLEKKIADENDNDRDSPLLPNTRGRYRSNRSRASDETPVNTVSAAEKQRPEGRDDGQADDVVFDMRYLTSDKEGQPDSSDASSSGSSRHRKSKKRTRTATARRRGLAEAAHHSSGNRSVRTCLPICPADQARADPASRLPRKQIATLRRPGPIRPALIQERSQIPAINTQAR
jgi:hypothetical protein